MTALFLDLVRAHCRPRRPITTDVVPQLKRLDGIRAVLFDVYGTLLVSASGDIGTHQQDVRALSIASLLENFSLVGKESSQSVLGRFDATIARHHERSREDGLPYPEVDIVTVWAEVLSGFEEVESRDLRRWAIEFELQTNPVWPMPQAGEVLSKLRESRRKLGLVSNAQFYTPLVLAALLGGTTQDLGLTQSLSIYSFMYGRGKPDTYLYEIAQQQLAQFGIGANETLMVGNDMLNDVVASQQVGFRTALFAGDQRSLRMRIGDERVAESEPDVIITELPQLFDCLGEVD